MTTTGAVHSAPVDRWQLDTVFQPIVELDNGVVIGAEAFTRDRTGASSISILLERARRDATVDRLDRMCQRAAVRSWLAAQVPARLSLFLNVEPSVVIADPARFADPHLDQLQEAGTRVVIEITEREVLRDPHALLRFRDQIRDRGWKLAIDDIGVEPSSLAILPLLAPDVLKLDMGLLHQAPGPITARTVNAVLAETERSGGAVLAEGIETEQQLDLAISAGATLGQGWMFGRPTAQLPPVSARQWSALTVERQPVEVVDNPTTPWHLVGGYRSVRRARKPLLEAISRHIELQVVAAEPATLILGAFQDNRYLNAATLRRYSAQARTAAFVGVLGVGVAAEPAPGVRGSNLQPDDPLVDEWTVVVISPYFAAALVAHDTHVPASSQAERQFDYLLTYDRNLAVNMARTIMDRFTSRA